VLLDDAIYLVAMNLSGGGVAAFHFVPQPPTERLGDIVVMVDDEPFVIRCGRIVRIHAALVRELRPFGEASAEIMRNVAAAYRRACESRAAENTPVIGTNFLADVKIIQVQHMSDGKVLVKRTPY
jgi:hypothetical protein